MKKKLTKKILNADLVEIEVNYGSLYHPQSQGAIEAFNKIISSSLSTVYDIFKNLLNY